MFQPDAIDSRKELMEMMGIQPSTQPSTDSKTPINSSNQPENAFSEQSAAYWSLKGKDLSTAYEKGQLVSNFNSTHKFEYEHVLLNFIRLVEEISRDELIKKGYTLDEIKNNLKALEEMFKVLAFNINNKVKPQEINAKTLIAALHGFINSYAQKIK
jgi:hypothetical protein